jgi:hypothetical protein
MISEDIDFNILTGDITDGTLIVDCWYDRITDNGSLSA